MAATTIGIKLQGQDAASAQIQKVSKSLSDMGVAAQAQATNISKGGDAIKAAMGAASGSISGTIGAVKGITTAIQGMGVAINTALPIAAAIGVAIFAIKKAYDAIQASHQAEIDKIKEETDARLEQSKAIDKAASSMRDLLAHQERMAKIQLDINGGTPLDQKELEGSQLKDRRKALGSELKSREGNLDQLGDRLSQLQMQRWGASGKDREGLDKQIEEVENAMQSEKDAILKLKQDRAYLGKQIELNAKQQRDILEAEEKENQKRMEEEKKRREEATAVAKKEKEAREKQIAMLELQIKGADKSEVAKVQAQFLQKEIDKISKEKNAVAEQMEKTPLGDKYVELRMLYDKLAGEEQVAIKTLEAHNAVEERRVKEEKEAEDKQKKAKEKQEKINQIKALEDEKKKQQGLAGDMRNASLFTANAHSTNLLLDKLRGAGNDSTTKDIAASTKSIDTKIQRLLDEIKKLNVA